MNKEELQAALDALCTAREKSDRAIEHLNDLLHTLIPHELRLQLAVKSALNALRAARDSFDRAMSAISDLLYEPTSQELSLRLAELEGWAAMEQYMSGRRQ